MSRHRKSVGGLLILEPLLQHARDEGVKLEIQIDGKANTVVLKDSLGGKTWVSAERYLDAMGAQQQGTEGSMANKLWIGLCKSRGTTAKSLSTPIVIDAPYSLKHAADEWDACHADVLTLKQLIARTILRGREELER